MGCYTRGVNAQTSWTLGSADRTQLILTLDRDSGTVAVLSANATTQSARLSPTPLPQHGAGKHIGICGQAPSDYTDFAEWLVQQGIDSISLNPGWRRSRSLLVAKAEAAQKNSKVRATTNS